MKGTPTHGTPRLIACTLCRANEVSLSDFLAGTINRAWACPDCPSRKMHGLSVVGLQLRTPPHA